MTFLTPILYAVAMTVLAIVVLIKLAPRLHLLDYPGGRKDHAAATPVVGGIAIALSLLLSLQVLAPTYAPAMTIAVALLMAIGVADDIREVPPFPKFIVQAIACLVMIYVGHVELKNVGNLIGIGDIGFWVLSVPMTIFAAIGVINAINMADGMDGQSGIIILVALTAYALVASESSLWDQYKTLLVLIGGTLAFLIFNLRIPRRKHAEVFFGDAGSMLMGFLLAWFAIDLSSGMVGLQRTAAGTPLRTFPPICALWVVVIPLCDCVSLMLRRLKSGRSPFAADRQHLHHFLLARGLRVGQANLLMLLGSILCASVGVGGWKLGIAQPILFASFVALFVGYHKAMSGYFKGRDVMTDKVG